MGRPFIWVCQTLTQKVNGRELMLPGVCRGGQQLLRSNSALDWKHNKQNRIYTVLLKFFCFLKEVSYAHQGCIYLIKIQNYFFRF